MNDVVGIIFQRCKVFCANKQLRSRSCSRGKHVRGRTTAALMWSAPAVTGHRVVSDRCTSRTETLHSHGFSETVLEAMRRRLWSQVCG